jgi:hypothetical protein
MLDSRLPSVSAWAIAYSTITRFSLEENQIPAAANSRASAFKQCRSLHLIPLKAYASGSYLLHAIVLRFQQFLNDGGSICRVPRIVKVTSAEIKLK